jgi:hypothetical protein
VWSLKGNKYQAFISALVIDEITKGDVAAAERRVQACKDAAMLNIDAAAENLAEQLISRRVISATEPEDALHIAIATLEHMDYILSFNFSHMVGAEAKFSLQTAIAQLGYKPPLLVTADDLLEALWNNP